MEELKRFISQYKGAIIGVIIAIIILATRLYDVIVAILLLLAGAIIGNYVQQNKDDVNRARGKVEVEYTSKSEDARQTALDKFKSNTYNHYISFKINRNSKLFDVDKMKIGTPLSVRTNNNIILDTYISAIKDDGSNFIEITCGNMRINFIDKILKERNK